MIPRLKPRYDFREWLAAFKISSGNIPEYEKSFASKFGCNYGVMFAHGRSGIYALLKVWGLENAEVICPAYTCVVVPNAIVLSGNIPVFVDCEDGSFNMSLEGIRQSITDKTRVIIPTHLFGYPMDVLAVQEIVNEAEQRYGHKIFVLQDCAHSYGAVWDGKMVSQYGDAAVFGSNISKIINSIFGGMITTNDRELADKLTSWREENIIHKGITKSFKRFLYFIAVNFAFNNWIYGMVNYLEKKGFLDYFVKYYEEDKIDLPGDWNQYPSEIEARIGLVQLKKYDKIIETRRANARRITEEMKGVSGITMLPFDENATYSHIVGIVNDREKWVEDYRNKGIQLGILIEYSVPLLSAYRKYRTAPTANSDKYSKSLINFPAYVEY